MNTMYMYCSHYNNLASFVFEYTKKNTSAFAIYLQRKQNTAHTAT